MIGDEGGWIRVYQELDALFIHDGNVNRPHPLLTSGLHSPDFFNSREVIPHEHFLRNAAYDLAELFVQERGNTERIDRVVGPQTGATKLSELLHNVVGILRERPCNWASPAKAEEDGKKMMVFSDPERCVKPGEYVLLCEDVVTTGGSIELTVRASEEKGGTILPFVLTLVNRSGLAEIDGRKIVALINHPIPMWEPEKCWLCQAGSETIKPKKPHSFP